MFTFIKISHHQLFRPALVHVNHTDLCLFSLQAGQLSNPSQWTDTTCRLARRHASGMGASLTDCITCSAKKVPVFGEILGHRAGFMRGLARTSACSDVRCGRRNTWMRLKFLNHRFELGDDFGRGSDADVVKATQSPYGSPPEHAARRRCPIWGRSCTQSSTCGPSWRLPYCRFHIRHLNTALYTQFHPEEYSAQVYEYDLAHRSRKARAVVGPHHSRGASD